MTSGQTIWSWSMRSVNTCAVRWTSRRLTKNAVVDVTGRICQPKVATGVAIGQLQMIQSHERQNGSVEIVNMHAVFRGVIAEVVGCAICEAGLRAAARHE